MMTNTGDSAGRPRQDPLFLVGDSRSGTTFLANILIHHEKIGLAPESSFATRLLDMIGDHPLDDMDTLESAVDVIYAEPKFGDWKLERTELLHKLRPILPLSYPDMVRTILLAYCDREFPGCTIWGLKKGGRYIVEASKLIRYFPEAKFINLLRDGRAVFNSKKSAIHSTLGKPLETSPIRAAERWNLFVDAFDALVAEHSAATLEVSFEKLIAEPDETLNKIYRFLGVEKDPSLASATSRDMEPSYVTARSQHLHPNVGKPPMPSRVEGWREELAPEEIVAYEMVAGENLLKKGYELVNENAHQHPTVAYRIRRSMKTLRKALRSAPTSW